MRARLALFLFVGCARSAAPSLSPPVTPVAPVATPALPSTPPPPPEEPVPVRPTEPFTLDDDLGRPVEVYPPLASSLAPTAPAPLVVFLHATCMQPGWVCDAFGSAGRDGAWLVCPSGNSTCAGEPDWYGPPKEKAAFLSHAIDLTESAVPAFVAPRPGVLVGWSRGAFAAKDVLQTRALPGRFRGLVLVAAAVGLDLKLLRELGIRRLVMAAGDWDGARGSMVATVAAAKAAGLEARWVSLGKIGHTWPPDFEARMREPIAWALE
ncbi:MAG: hypothetical protein JNL79_21240 [Myxococcales bacterium]|nr:hypothetical protein [Myxococcales bacterium]